MKYNESILQQNCVRWFRRVWPEYSYLYFAVPNGADVSDRQRMKLTAEGMVRGVSDTLLLVPSPDGRYHGMAIEYKKKTYDVQQTGSGLKLKTRHTYQSPEQKAWQEHVEKAGFKYIVVWDFEQFKKEIADYFDEDRDNLKNQLNKILKDE